MRNRLVKYVGSKSRHAKHFLPTILKGRGIGTIYVEPFVGGGNVIDKVGNWAHRLGSDINPYLIALLRAVRDGWVPPDEVSQEQYFAIRANPDRFPPEFTAFAMFCCSFGSNWGNGYGRERRADGLWHGVADVSQRTLLKQAPQWQGVEFVCSHYRDLGIPKGAVVYCDPPYADSVRKDAANANAKLGLKRFDPADFWNWADFLVRRGHDVFVSEYRAPAHWTPVWEREVHANINKNSYQHLPERNDKTKDRINVERLFVHRATLEQGVAQFETPAMATPEEKTKCLTC